MRESGTFALIATLGAISIHLVALIAMNMTTLFRLQTITKAFQGILIPVQHVILATQQVKTDL